MLHVIWNVYNEMDNLPKAVEACDKAIGGDVCNHIFVDGRYKDYPGSDWLSTDGTVGFCYDAGTYLPATDLDEIGKYNLGLAFCDEVAARDQDWILFLDADEELQALAEPPDGAEVGLLNFVWDSDGESRDRARLYRWKPGLRFKGRHYTLYHGDQMVATLDGPGVPAGSGIHHNRSHSPERREVKKIYYRHLLKKERGLPR